MTESTPAGEAPATQGTAQPRAFFGWRVVGAAFVAQLLTVGLTLAAFGNFVGPIATEFEISRGEVSRALALPILVMGLMGAVLGSLIDRGHVKRLFLGGLALLVVGLLAMSRAQSLAQLALGYGGLVAVGAACFGAMPSMALVANWFVRRRGLGLGIAVAGATVASMGAPVAAAAMIEAGGWRVALIGMGVAAVLIGLPVFATCVIARPEEIGQRPDGDPPSDAAQHSAPLPEADVVDARTLVKEARLWLLSVGFGLMFTTPIVMTAALVPYGLDLGFSAIEAAWFFTAAGPFSILGKVIFGAVADRMPAHPAVWLIVSVNVLVWCLLYLGPSYVAFLATGALYGLGIGSIGPLNGVVIGRCYGREAFGRASGIGGLASLPLVALAPVASGMVLDATGGYQAVFVLVGGLLVLGAILISIVHIPRR